MKKHKTNLVREILLVFILAFPLNIYSQKKVITDLKKSGINGKVKSYTESNYNPVEAFGKIVKGEKIAPPGIYLFKYYFNLQGYYTEVISYYNNDEIQNQDKYSYYFDKNMSEIRDYGYNGSFVFRWVSKYDMNGNEIESIKYWPQGGIASRFTYKYDNYRNIIEEKRFYSDNSFSTTKYIYKYDNLGRITENTEYQDLGTSSFYVSEKRKYKYNVYGNIIEELIYNRGEDLYLTIKYEYEYDTRRNWIQKIEYVNNTLEKITEREYEYYN